MPGKRGAPRGNQNARKHGFYSAVLAPNELKQLKQAASVTGIDAEIAVLRVKLRSVLQNSPDNFELFSRGTVSVARLLRTRLILLESRENKNLELGVVIRGIITDIGVPLGVMDGPKNYPEPDSLETTPPP